jgi:hypothetical protein
MGEAAAVLGRAPADCHAVRPGWHGSWALVGCMVCELYSSCFRHPPASACSTAACPCSDRHSREQQATAHAVTGTAASSKPLPWSG